MRTKTEIQNKLPEGIKKSDLTYPKDYEDRLYDMDFEIWFVPSFGWVIPTLGIRKAGRLAARGFADRTYAIKIDDSGICRVGCGPHVKDRFHVYVTKARLKDLKKYVEIRDEGVLKANRIRDFRTTRSAQRSLRRMGF